MRNCARLNPSWLAKFVTLFVALTALPVLAESQQSPVLLPITMEAGAPDLFPAEALTQHLAKVNSLLGTLAIPTETKITVGGRYLDSNLDRGTFELYVGMKNSPEQLVSLTHEYGHAILDKNLVLNSEAYRLVKPSLLSRAEDRKAGKPGVDRAEKIFKIVTTLHEFFADVVAVTAHQDPQALRHFTIEFKKDLTEGSMDDLTTRDFETRADSPRHQNWKKFLPFAMYVGDFYYALLPARWEFWNLAKNSVMHPEPQPVLLSKVYKAVEKVLDEVLRQWTDAEMGGKKLEPELVERLNQRLIEELRVQLAP